MGYYLYDFSKIDFKYIKDYIDKPERRVKRDEVKFVKAPDFP